MRLSKFWELALSGSLFSIAYAVIEYYVIRDASFGMNPVLFSLIYPYHFAMLAAFGIAAYGLLRAQIRMKGFLTSIVLIGALVSSMLVVEDFAWFALRAGAPVDGDANGGKLVIPGEWTTKFAGSTDAYFTAIPNWYFASLVFSAIALVIFRERDRPLVARKCD
jgi:hypothetical protein